jgi:hypothetical protein
MIRAEERYAINEAAVLHETVDEETIAINLESGTYYALSASAFAVWQELTRRATAEGIARTVAGYYEGSIERVREAVYDFLDLLLAENLIRPEKPQAAPAGPPLVWPPAHLAEPFASSFEKYTDLSEELSGARWELFSSGLV